MSTISIRGGSPDKAIPLLTDALDREKRVIAGSLKATRDKVNALAKLLNVDVDALMRGDVEHSEAVDMQLLELEGEVTLMLHLEAELRELEALEICR